jgi:hypothetical protein
MTSTLIAILSLTVLGLPLALAADRRSRGPMLIGTSFLYGSGAIFIVFLTLSIIHIRWTLVSVGVTAMAIFCAAAAFTRMRPVDRTTPQAVRPYVFDIITVIAIIGYVLYATLARLGLWDFWAIWGLKARTFLEIGGIDWRFVESRWNAFSHPDYPLLVPLNFDFVTLVGGGWSDRWLGLLFVAWGIALLLIVRALAARETTPFVASLLTLTLAALALSSDLGMAEGALIAFGGAGVLFVRAALADDDAASWRNGALMLGFAANCKNEGVALLVAVTIAVIAVSWSRGRSTARHLWPAYALAAPWLLLRARHTLPTDLVSGSAVSRLLARLPHTHQILVFLGARLHEPWFWVALLIGILVVPGAARRREAFVLLATAIQLAFYVGAYLTTPHDLRWHVMTSWWRLTGQVAIPITFVVFLMLANSLRRSQDAPHAEARSDE